MAAFEVTALLFTFLLAGMLQLEAIRRADVAVVFHQAAFDRTRRLALGVPQGEVERRLRGFLRAALGAGAPSRARTWDVRRGGARGSSIHARFPSFLALDRKHHTEVTETCWFPF